MSTKKPKLSGKKTRVPSPYDTASHKTERTCVAKVAEWLNRIIDKKSLDIGPVEVETGSADNKYPDIVIFKNSRSQDVLCIGEFKRPYFDPFDEQDLKEPAREKATYRSAPYFVTSNFQKLIWFNTARANNLRPEEEQIHEKYGLSEIEDLDLIDESRYRNSIIAGLERFIVDLYEVHTGKKEEPRQAIDELLIFRLHDKVDRLARYYGRIIDDRVHKDPEFSIRLQSWFAEQNWGFAWQEADFAKAARQAAYLLFKILEKEKGKLVPLKKIAKVRRGFTTGANEFFYLAEEEIKRRGIEKEFWMHQDGEGNCTPNYVIKSPRECKSILVKPEDLKYRVLMIHRDRKDLKGTNVLKYIQEGERKGYHKRPTCASRRRWYDLGERETAQILIPERFWDRFSIFWNNASVLENKNLYGLISSLDNVTPLAACLNSVLFVMSLELFSRGTLGQGVLDIDVRMVANIPVVNPFDLFEVQNRKLEATLGKLSKPPTESIFSELGAASLEEVSLDKVKPARRELDKIVMGEILGLSDEEQLEVYKAVVDLVRSRIEKARSFGKKHKAKGGIDIDLLIKTTMDKIGDETLGKFYRERILNRKRLYTKTLPRVSGATRIEQDLLGWRLYAGRRHIDCSSELEARYLKVWLEVGLEEVRVPQDEGNLREILPDLEALKDKIDGVIENYLGAILDIKLQTRILHQLWQEIVK